MAGNARTWFSPKQRAELWERWKSGQCVADIARALERPTRAAFIGVSQQQIARRVRDAPRRVPAWPRRSRLCRGPERCNRIPLGVANMIGSHRWRLIWYGALRP